MAKAIAKTAAIAVAAGLTFAGSAGIATDALAQTTNTADPAPRATEQKAASSSIPEGSNFSLTVNKRYNPTELRVGTGQEDAKVSGAALEGAKFKVEKLQGDIRKQEDFNRLAKLSQEYNKAGVANKPTITKDTGFTAKELSTDSDGKATFSNLPAGAYLVTETKTADTLPAPAAKFDKNGTETLIPADPFIVFLPMTNPAGEGWISNVNVYPKNSFARVEKTVADKDKHALKQDKVTYTLTGVVPSAQEGKKLDWFGLRDAYNNTEITPDYENLTVKVISTDGAEKDLTKGTDFAVGADAGYGSVADKNLAAGANAGFFVGVKPSVLKPGDRVIATVNAKLLEGANADQEVENSVREYFRHSTDDSSFSEVPPKTPPTTPPGGTPPSETPNDKVVSYFGNIEVYKTGEENGTRKALEGATFEVGKCNADGTKIDGDAITSGKTDKEGKLTFQGLHVTDYADNAVVQDPGKYCLRETKAPAGYTFDKNAVYPLELTRKTKNGKQPANFLTSTDAKSAGYAEGGTKIMNGVAVNNIKNSVPLLPNTGGMGVLIIVLAGLAIIGGGVYAARRNSQAA